MKTEPNDPASPIKQWDWIGLTKREYFAAMAMMGILADGCSVHELSEAACVAVEAADALINALNQDK